MSSAKLWCWSLDTTIAVADKESAQQNLDAVQTASRTAPAVIKPARLGVIHQREVQQNLDAVHTTKRSRLGGNQTCKTRSNPSTGSSAKFGCCSRLLHKHLAVATMKGPSIGGRQSCKTRSKPSTESTAIFELMGSFFRPSFR